MELNEYIGTSGRAVQGTNFTIASHDSVSRLSWWGTGGCLEYFFVLVVVLGKKRFVYYYHKGSCVFSFLSFFFLSLYLSFFYFFFLYMYYHTYYIMLVLDKLTEWVCWFVLIYQSKNTHDKPIGLALWSLWSGSQMVSVNQISSEKLELDIPRVTTEIINKYFNIFTLLFLFTYFNCLLISSHFW